MNQQDIFPAYTPRKNEEKRIRALVSSVQKDGISRALLLYGNGGVGKSYLLRNLPQRLSIENVVYVGPIDVDDAEFWSTTNLNHYVAEQLAQGEFFQNYKASLIKMPEVEQEKLGHETVLAHLRKAYREFVADYRDFVKRSGQTPVLIFDTVEAIRGTDTLTRLLLWIKNLTGTLIILSGRPVQGIEDPAARELDELPKLGYERLLLNEFSRAESLSYLAESPVEKRLDEEEKQRLALMSKGHPLWLALSIYYLNEVGVPEEVEKLDIIASKAEWPYQNGALHDAYLRRLVIPYREGGFWHEAVFRLGIVRRRVSKELWRQMMSDQPLPPDAPTWEEAWKKLLDFPWVRPRANEKYVTLQDVLAEELARRIIPYRDFTKEQRTAMWQDAVKDYDRQIVEQQAAVAEIEKPLDSALAELRSAELQSELLEQVLNLDKQEFEIFLLRTTRLYYQMLCDFETGTREFIRLMDDANQHHQIRFVGLLWAEMQRFLPDGASTFDPLEDIVKSEIKGFHQWYREQPGIQFEIITRVAKYLYEIGRADDSEKHLNQLWAACEGNDEWEYEILRLRGNARVRNPGQVRVARGDFEAALERTRREGVSETVRNKAGQALSELGYYHRNTGDWTKAAEYYHDALRIHHQDDATIAGIQSQYAYIQALRGLYQNAHELVDSAIEIRRLLELTRYVGMALSVKGEVCRYERDFQAAWPVYLQAEEIFTEVNDWGWLGLIRQEMAICLFQASEANRLLPGYSDTREMKIKAREMALGALDYCREYSRRSYPSALNRAGRIIGKGVGEYDSGLEYLEEGIHEAVSVADGWFWFANLIEYVELCYIAWQTLEDDTYLAKISTKAQDIEQASSEYVFSDLRGRWEILQGQLKAPEANQFSGVSERERQNILLDSLDHFSRGYPMIAHGYVGSHGAIALGSEFEKLGVVLNDLDETTRQSWFESLETAWSTKPEKESESYKVRQTSSLLALLNRLRVRLRYVAQERDNGE